MKRAVLRAGLAALALAFAGCSATYYNAMEKFGVAKREILADRVEETREAQQEAKQEFADALQRFLAVTKTDVATPARVGMSAIALRVT